MLLFVRGASDRDAPRLSLGAVVEPERLHERERIDKRAPELRGEVGAAARVESHATPPGAIGRSSTTVVSTEPRSSPSSRATKTSA